MALSQNAIDTLREMISRASTTEAERANAKDKLTRAGIDWRKPVEKRNSTSHKDNSFGTHNDEFTDMNDFLNQFMNGRYKEYATNSNRYSPPNLTKKYKIKIQQATDIMFLNKLCQIHVGGYTGFSLIDNCFAFESKESEKNHLFKIFNKNRLMFYVKMKNHIDNMYTTTDMFTSY